MATAFPRGVVPVPACILAAGLAVAASSPAAGAGDAALEQVVVTAQRRLEALRTVPVAATVLSGEQLERARIADVDGLQYLVPNLTNGPANVTRNALGLTMRGLGSQDNSPSVDPAVGVYLDEVYLGRMVGFHPRTLDLERVEVLRGPQGTLYGRNTIGGAINLVSRKPGAEFEGRLRLTRGNYDRAEVDGFVNLPWGDGHALRATGLVGARDGFARTLAGAELDDERQRVMRLQYRYTASRGQALDLSFDHTGIDSGSERRTLLAVAPGAESLPAAFGRPDDDLSRYVDPHAARIPADISGQVRSRVQGVAAVLSADTAGFALKAISSYRRLESRAVDADTDATPYDLAINRRRSDDQHQFSQELQAYGSAFDGRTDWIAGLHHFEERGRFRQRVRTFVPTTRLWNETMPAGDTRHRSTALYLQLDQALSPRWTLSGGARHAREGRQLTSYNATINAGTEFCRLSVQVRDDAALCRATLPERWFSYVPWTLSLGYQRDADSLYYAKLSRGFRSGGYNIRGVGLVDLATFDPERVTAWELGVHLAWPDSRFTVDGAVFHTDFDAIQVSERDPTPLGFLGASVIRNGGRARIHGGEFEAAARLGPARVSVALGLTRARYTFLRAAVQEVTLDSPFVQTPERSASIGLDLPLRLGTAAWTLRADYGWRSEVSFDNPSQTLARQAAFGLLNLQLATRAEPAGFEFAIWARNLGDERYLVRAYASEYLYTAIPGEPRTFGLTLGYRFRR